MQRGLNVTVVHIHPHLMEQQLDAQAADLLRGELERRTYRRPGPFWIPPTTERDAANAGWRRRNAHRADWRRPRLRRAATVTLF